MGQKVAAFLISFGEENFFLDRDLQSYRNWSDRTVIEVDGGDVSEQELVSICETRPAEDRPRIVIVDNGQKLKGEKTLKQYIAKKEKDDTECILAVVVRDGKLSAHWKEAASKGIVNSHDKLKTWDNNNQVIPFIQEEAKGLGLKIERQEALDFYVATGANLHRIYNELKKLAIYLGKGAKVTRPNLVKLLTRTVCVEPYEVAEWAVKKDIRNALNNLSVLYQNSSDDPTIPVAYSIMRQVEKLIVARDLLDKNASEDEIAARVGMNAWRCKTHFIHIAKKHSLVSLGLAMQRLCKLDMGMKTTGPSKRTLLELAILSLAN